MKTKEKGFHIYLKFGENLEQLILISIFQVFNIWDLATEKAYIGFIENKICIKALLLCQCKKNYNKTKGS